MHVVPFYNEFLLQIDLLPEIHIPPRIFAEVDAALKAKQVKSEVDEYLKVMWMLDFLNLTSIVKLFTR